jgi:acetoin utilization deacetylase AcuC-like enzyme
MEVTEKGFGAMAKRLLALAEKFAGARIAFLLEGGYDLAALKNSVATVLNVMQNSTTGPDERLNIAASRIEPLLHRIQQVHEKYRLS